MKHFYTYKIFTAIIIYLLITACCICRLDAHPATEHGLLKIDYSIGDISFVFKDNDTFGKNSLLYIMTLPKKTAFSKEDLEFDMLRLKKFYFDNGFFDAVIDTAVVYSAENETADITFFITERTRYTLHKIDYSGIEHVTDEVKQKINSGQQISAGDYYNRVKILTEMGRIVGLLQNNGYPFARLDTSQGIIVSKYLPSTAVFKYYVNVKLSFIGTEHQFRFGKTKIIIAKNIYQLEQPLVERELAYKEGELYSRENVRQSESNFSKISIIQSGRIQIDSVIEDKNLVHMTANIILNNKYELTPNLIGVDIDNQFFVGAGLEYSDRNFFGGGRTFSIAPQGLAHSMSVNRAELNSTFYQPYFFSNKITATYNLRLGYYNIDEFIQVTSLRNLFRLSYFIAPYTFYNNAFTDLTVDLLRTKYKKDDVVEGDTIRAGTLTNQMNSIIGLTVIHNNTNDVFNPSEGFYHSISVEDGGLLPRALSLIIPNIQYSQYVKLYMINKFFFDISKGNATSIFATQIKVGDIIEYGRGPNIVPIAVIYKFISGGSNSLRGWNAKENGILDNTENGGNFLFEGSFELRRKFFDGYESFLRNIWAVFFLDYGNVWEKDKFFRLGELALDIGFGVRYDTFVGPLRVDLGFRLFDPSADPGNRWLFSKPGSILKSKFAVQFGLGNAF